MYMLILCNLRNPIFYLEGSCLQVLEKDLRGAFSLTPPHSIPANLHQPEDYSKGGTNFLFGVARYSRSHKLQIHS